MMVAMPRATRDDDEEERDEDPSADDVARFSRAQTRRCHECRHQMHDEADICPKCHAFQWDDERGHARSPGRKTIRFAIVLAVVLTALTLSGLLFVLVR